jgi:LysR family transcriptional regulator, hca operon transcriptional activator
MDLRHLRYFIVVAEELNFTRAAERLHTVQPSLSSQIRRLEEIVGTPLLYRTKHYVELTPAGRSFLEDARKIVVEVDRSIERAIRCSHSDVGELCIGFVAGMEDVIIPRIMTQMQRKFPDIRFRLVSSNDAELIAALRRHVIDVIFCAPIEDPEIILDVVSEIVFRMEMVAIFPAEYDLAGLKRIPVQMLAEKPFIQPMPGKYSHADKSITEITVQSGIRFRTCGYADGALTAVNAVSSGLGFGLVPDFMTRKLPSSVIARPLDLPDPPQSPIAVAYRREDDLPALKHFLTILHDYVQEHELEISTFKKNA